MPMLNKIIPPTLIGEGCKSQGSLLFAAEAEVSGIVEGDLDQESTESLQIGKSGWIRGSIRSRGPVLIEGRVEGSVESKMKIHLGPTATVLGSLHAPSICVDAGALFEGEVEMRVAHQTSRNLGPRLKVAA